MRVRQAAWVLIVVLAAAVVACSGPLPVVEMHGDYATYDQTSLVEESTLIVEATVVSSRYKVVTPILEDKKEGDPLYGLTDEQKKQAREAAEESRTPGTEVTLKVAVVHRGDVKPGDKLTILQAGGAMDGKMFIDDMQPPLVKGDSYLLFAAQGRPDSHFILGGSAGMFRAGDDGAFEAVNPDSAPFKRLTSAEVRGLV